MSGRHPKRGGAGGGGRMRRRRGAGGRAETVGIGSRRWAQRALVEFESADPQHARIGTALEAAGRALGSAVGPGDRAFAHELAYGVVRRLRTIDRILIEHLAQGLPGHAPTRAALRLGVLQLGWTSVPRHAAVHTSVALVSEGPRAGLLNAVLRRVADRIVTGRPTEGVPAQSPPRDPGDLAATALRLPGRDDGGHARYLVLEPADDLPAPGTPAWTALEQGLPAWLVEDWTALYGAVDAQKVAEASSAPPAVFLRAEPGGRDELIARLRVEVPALPADRGAPGSPERAAPGASLFRPSPDHPDAVRVEGGGHRVFETAAYRDGVFVVQDPTAVQAVDAVGAVRGESVLDLCAAPGTKTTRLAVQVRGDGGRVVAVDPHQGRRRRIAHNLERLGLADVVEVRGTLEDLPAEARFDAVLVDAPCSNTGVLARRPEARHRLLRSDLEVLARTQEDLLRAAILRCRPGGRVVYSTCSLEQRENHDVVAAVLAHPPEGTVVECRVERTILPLTGRRDGGFHAVLRVGAGRGD